MEILHPQQSFSSCIWLHLVRKCFTIYGPASIQLFLDSAASKCIWSASSPFVLLGQQQLYFIQSPPAASRFRHFYYLHLVGPPCSCVLFSPFLTACCFPPFLTAFGLAILPTGFSLANLQLHRIWFGQRLASFSWSPPPVWQDPAKRSGQHQPFYCNNLVASVFTHEFAFSWFSSCPARFGLTNIRLFSIASLWFWKASFPPVN